MSVEPTLGKPRLVFWETTQGCNLRCRHCRATATELSSPDDLPTDEAKGVLDQIAAYSSPILVLSGGEPLYRKDIFELADHARSRGLRIALATNGTLVDETMARRIVEVGVKRVSISLDGADAATHDAFRGIPGAFEAALNGFRNLKKLGMPVQINMSIARHNAAQLPDVLRMAKAIGADALHTFLLVPVGCGVDLQQSEMVDPIEYERILNWFYDESLKGEIELKATCAPHYFRVSRQRMAAERRAARLEAASSPEPNAHAIAPSDIAMPGSTGVEFKHAPAGHPGSTRAHAGSHPGGHPSGHPQGMSAVTKGCLAGTGVCFISYEGGVYPCGYLPALAGDLKRQSFAEVWEKSQVFAALRDDSQLKGKCGACEFVKVCMGCRARAYAATGDFMEAEPFCIYQPGGPRE